MKLFELIGDPKVYKQRKAEAERIIRAELDRRIKQMSPPGGVERRKEEERRTEPPNPWA